MLRREPRGAAGLWRGGGARPAACTPRTLTPSPPPTLPNTTAQPNQPGRRRRPALQRRRHALPRDPAVPRGGRRGAARLRLRRGHARRGATGRGRNGEGEKERGDGGRRGRSAPASTTNTIDPTRPNPPQTHPQPPTSKRQHHQQQHNNTPRRQVEAYYFHHYAVHFGHAEYGLANRSIPYAMTWDDHDIFDGWGSYPEPLQLCDVFQASRVLWLFLRVRCCVLMCVCCVFAVRLVVFGLCHAATKPPVGARPPNASSPPPHPHTRTTPKHGAGHVPRVAPLLPALPAAHDARPRSAPRLLRQALVQPGGVTVEGGVTDWWLIGMGD